MAKNDSMAPMKTTRRRVARLRRRSLRARGGSSMTPGSGVFGAQGEARQHVRAEVDRQHLQGAERNEADARRSAEKMKGNSSAMLCEKM